MTKQESLELDIDLRLVDVWGEATQIPEGFHEMFAALLRAAYGKGYTDALREPVRGQLCADHGYIIPKRKCA